MRWPLRRQILAPMLSVMLVTVAGVSGTSAWLSSRRTLGEIENQLQDVAATLSASNFPLKRGVLRQTRGLTGAEYAVTDVDGGLVASSDDPISAAPRDEHQGELSHLSLGRTVEIEGAQYFYSVWNLDRRPSGDAPMILHVYYPERRWREAQREAVLPPLGLGAAAIVVIGLVSLGIASRVTRPIERLRRQVERIAEGDFQPLPPTRRDDEIRDLCLAVNRMAALLARYEDQVRRTERLRTLGQLGGGLAHHMRNAATGCRMALDLHRRSCEHGDSDENLAVAERQLTLMEQHLRRFLSLGRAEARPHVPIALDQLVGEVLPLVRPMAAHVGVQLEYQPADGELTVKGDPTSLQQVLVNLLLNAIEATACARSSELTAGDAPQRVTLSLERHDESAVLTVSDTGAGPQPDVAASMFEPLISDKADGAGLGLAVAREIAEHHGGSLRWKRLNDETRFEFELPLVVEKTAHGTLVDR